MRRARGPSEGRRGSWLPLRSFPRLAATHGFEVETRPLGFKQPQVSPPSSGAGSSCVVPGDGWRGDGSFSQLLRREGSE